VKYLLLALLFTTGCTTTNSEYFTGCRDVLDVILVGPPKESPEALNRNKNSLCGALESRRFRHAEEMRERAGGKALR